MKKRFFLIAVLCIAVSATAFCQKKTTTAPQKKAPASVQKSPSTTKQHSTVNAVDNRLDGKEGLPEFEKTGGKPFLDILREKEATCSISPEPLEARTVSALLWAACGKTDAPESYTALYTGTKPCVDLYLVNQEGIYKYDRMEHKLNQIVHGHFLNQILPEEGDQSNAPIALFYAYTPEEVEVTSENGENIRDLIAGINCGAIMQNVCLFCVNENLSCRQFTVSDVCKENLKRHLHGAHVEIIFAQSISRK